MIKLNFFLKLISYGYKLKSIKKRKIRNLKISVTRKFAYCLGANLPDAKFKDNANFSRKKDVLTFSEEFFNEALANLNELSRSDEYTQFGQAKIKTGFKQKGEDSFRSFFAAPAYAQDAFMEDLTTEKLCDAINKIEKKSNAEFAKEYVVGLKGLEPDKAWLFIMELSGYLANHHGIIVSAVLHAGKGDKGLHAHLTCTTRRLKFNCISCAGEETAEIHNNVNPDLDISNQNLSPPAIRSMFAGKIHELSRWQSEDFLKVFSNKDNISPAIKNLWITEKATQQLTGSKKNIPLIKTRNFARNLYDKYLDKAQFSIKEDSVATQVCRIIEENLSNENQLEHYEMSSYLNTLLTPKQHEFVFNVLEKYGKNDLTYCVPTSDNLQQIRSSLTTYKKTYVNVRDIISFIDGMSSSIEKMQWILNEMKKFYDFDAIKIHNLDYLENIIQNYAVKCRQDINYFNAYCSDVRWKTKNIIYHLKKINEHLNSNFSVNIDCPLTLSKHFNTRLSSVPKIIKELRPAKRLNFQMDYQLHSLTNGTKTVASLLKFMSNDSVDINDIINQVDININSINCFKQDLETLKKSLTDVVKNTLPIDCRENPEDCVQQAPSNKRSRDEIEHPLFEEENIERPIKRFKSKKESDEEPAKKRLKIFSGSSLATLISNYADSDDDLDNNAAEQPSQTKQKVTGKRKR